MWLALALVLFGCQDPPTSVLSQTWVADGERSINDMTLTFDDGGELTPEWFAGHTTIVALGYTSCPDVCPTTLSGVATALDALAADGIAARGLFIAVDPERDTGGLSDYVRHFHRDIRGATGTPEALQQAASALGGAFELGDGPHGPTVDHSTSVFIVDANARVAGYQLRPSDGASLASDLRQWTREQGPSIVAEQAWVRPAIPGTRVTAGYGTLLNHGPQALTVVGADSPLAAQVALHETFTEGTLTGMRPTTLRIPSDGSSQLRPGGAHFMVFDLAEGVQSVPLELALEDGTTAWVRIPVTEP